MPRHQYTDKPRLKRDGVHIELLKCFGDGITTPVRCWKHINEKFAVSRPTVEKVYRTTYPEWAENVGKQLQEETISKDALALRKRIKTKTERVLEIQNMLDTNTYRETIYDFKRSAPISYTRELTPLERKALYERIAKMEGDDTPIKVAQTDTDGQTIRKQTIRLPNGVEIDLS